MQLQSKPPLKFSYKKQKAWLFPVEVSGRGFPAASVLRSLAALAISGKRERGMYLSKWSREESPGKMGSDVDTNAAAVGCHR